MITIAVVNMKGGSAKSSTCYHLGGMFASGGANPASGTNPTTGQPTTGQQGASAPTRGFGGSLPNRAIPVSDDNDDEVDIPPFMRR